MFLWKCVNWLNFNVFENLGFWNQNVWVFNRFSSLLDRNNSYEAFLVLFMGRILLNLHLSRSQNWEKILRNSLKTSFVLFHSNAKWKSKKFLSRHYQEKTWHWFTPALDFVHLTIKFLMMNHCMNGSFLSVATNQFYGKINFLNCKHF